MRALAGSLSFVPGGAALLWACMKMCVMVCAMVYAMVYVATFVIKPADAEELNEGMVLGQTVSVAGQDFYQRFVTLWRDKAISERYLLIVRERPSARTGSIVWIESSGRRLLQLSLPASRSLIARLSEQAVEDVWQRLTEAEIEARINGDDDLAKDEL